MHGLAQVLADNMIQMPQNPGDGVSLLVSKLPAEKFREVTFRVGRFSTLSTILPLWIGSEQRGSKDARVRMVEVLTMGRFYVQNGAPGTQMPSTQRIASLIPKNGSIPCGLFWTHLEPLLSLWTRYSLHWRVGLTGDLIRRVRLGS
jgi:hypothetical protein